MIRQKLAVAGFLIALALFMLDVECVIWGLFETFEATAGLLIALALLATIPAVLGTISGLAIDSALHRAFGGNTALTRFGNLMLGAGLIAFAGTSLAFAVLVVAAPSGMERRLEPSLSKLARPGDSPRPPNVVLIVADSFRQDVLELDEAASIAPNLLRLQSESLSFTSSQAVSSWTHPSMAGLVTGRYPTELGAHHSGLSNDAITLAERFHAAGYETVGVSDNYLTGPSFGFAQGFEFYRQKNAKLLLLRLAVSKILPKGWLDALVVKFRLLYQGAPSVNAAVGQWLAQRDPQRPFFLMLHYMDVHYPYYVYSEHPENWSNRSTAQTHVPYYEPLYEVSSSSRSRGPFGEMTMPAPQREDLWNRYLGSVQYLDQHLAEVTAMLRSAADWDNTVVVFTADHGEEFFEHGFFSHGSSLYQESVRVPLLVKLPKGMHKGSRSDPVSSLWIMPTLLEVAGISHGQSGLPASLLRGGNASTPVFSEFERRGVKIISGQLGAHKLLLAQTDDGRSKVELFDVVADPGEQRNLWSEGDAATSELHARLVAFEHKLREFEAQPHAGPSETDLEGLKALGYLR